MLGDRTHMGVWQHRGFRVSVGANGTLDLRLGSRNTGSLFQTACKYSFVDQTVPSDCVCQHKTPIAVRADNGWGDGMVSWAIQALTLHRAVDTHLLTPWAAASLARNDAIGHAALRGWLVAGPFEDANATGLERSFPPEAATLDSPNQSLE